MSAGLSSLLLESWNSLFTSSTIHSHYHATAFPQGVPAGAELAGSFPLPGNKKMLCYFIKGIEVLEHPKLPDQTVTLNTGDLTLDPMTTRAAGEAQIAVGAQDAGD